MYGYIASFLNRAIVRGLSCVDRRICCGQVLFESESVNVLILPFCIHRHMHKLTD